MTAPGTSTTTRTRTSTARTELSEADLAALRSPAIDPAAVDASERQTPVTLFFLYLFIVVPFLALLLAIPMAWGGFMGPVDVGLLVFFYSLTALGITIGFHRHFTHGSFKANRPLRIALAIAGTYAIEGPLDRWVADHRKHHAHTDKEGDPHSPHVGHGDGVHHLGARRCAVGIVGAVQMDDDAGNCEKDQQNRRETRISQGSL